MLYCADRKIVSDVSEALHLRNVGSYLSVNAALHSRRFENAHLCEGKHVTYQVTNSVLDEPHTKTVVFTTIPQLALDTSASQAPVYSIRRKMKSCGTLCHADY